MPRTTTGYSDALIDHFEHPRNAGAMDDADAEAFVTNPVCGDSMRIFLRIEDERVAAASFLTSGCPASIGTSSAATELLTGRTLDEAVALTRDDYADAVGGLPRDFAAQPAETEARFVFYTGSRNRFFLPESQVRAFEMFEGSRPNFHKLNVLQKHSHLDVFMGQRAATEVFPQMVRELDGAE